MKTRVLAGGWKMLFNFLHQWRKKSHGVTVQAKYTVGEYDILILSALESDGLEILLQENGYRIPQGAAKVLGNYIKLNMRCC